MENTEKQKNKILESVKKSLEKREPFAFFNDSGEVFISYGKESTIPLSEKVAIMVNGFLNVVSAMSNNFGLPLEVLLNTLKITIDNVPQEFFDKKMEN